MLINFTKKILLWVDLLLPKKMALWPYDLAAFCVRKKIASDQDCQVWFRNSYAKKNIVFGVSDLDITVNIKSFDRAKIIKIKRDLKKLKIFFPFLGETNFYINDELFKLCGCLNHFERKRDLSLDQMIPSGQNVDSKVDSVVYFLRMMISDRNNLLTDPTLRQKKWRKHFEEIGLIVPGFIDKDIIMKTIINLIQDPAHESEISEALNFIFSKSYSYPDLFHAEKAFCWKFLFPHLYLWEEDLSKEKLHLMDSGLFKLICLRQIDWEIWGINSQLPFLSDQKSSIEIHMSRLKRLALVFSSEDQALQVDELIENSKRY